MHVELVGRSDVVVIGTAGAATSLAPRLVEATVQVDVVLLGAAPGGAVTVRGPRVAPGARHVFFLRRDGARFENVAPAGTVFPSRPEDDESYRQAVDGVRRALAAPGAEQAAALRSALIPVLSASAAPLRYHAALELAARAHHAPALTPDERQALERTVADPTLDPALRPIVSTLLRRATAAR
jgi:hypothetical protein